MPENEKQESQKTVVAFISGLLIGGLLVWVFSSAPETVEEPDVMDETDVELADDMSDMEEDMVDDVTADVDVTEAAIAVADQPAGTQVVIGEVSFPSETGWVVVREIVEGVPSNVLGAARYSTDDGQMPETIELIRGTTAGGTYQVVFFTNAGDEGFSLEEDMLIEGVGATFMAS